MWFNWGMEPTPPKKDPGFRPVICMVIGVVLIVPGSLMAWDAAMLIREYGIAGSGRLFLVDGLIATLVTMAGIVLIWAGLRSRQK